MSFGTPPAGTNPLGPAASSLCPFAESCMIFCIQVLHSGLDSEEPESSTQSSDWQFERSYSRMKVSWYSWSFKKTEKKELVQRAYKWWKRDLSNCSVGASEFAL